MRKSYVFMMLLFVLASVACSSSELEDGEQNGVECTSDNDCPQNYRCFDTRCHEYCENDDDCSTGFCDEDKNICLPGESDGDKTTPDSYKDSDTAVESDSEKETDGPSCVEDEKRCDPDNNLQVQKCQDQQWVFFKTCQSFEPCLEGECTNIPDSDEDYFFDSDSDNLEEPDSEPEDDVEFVCEHGATRCKNEMEVEVCDNNVWTDQRVCYENQICLDGKCVNPPDGDSELELECVCTAADGPCCDGCHFYPSSRKCEDLPGLEGCDFGSACGSAITERAQQRFCDGYSSSCSGNVYTFSPVVKQNCEPSQRCAWSPQNGSDCVSDDSCQCQCSVGPCCSDGCHYNSSNSICDVSYEEQYYCDPVDPTDPSDMCGSLYKKQTSVRYCSGYSNACTGTISSLSNPEVVQACYSTQTCDEDNTGICVNDASCSWACTEGPCCDVSTHSFKLAGTVCQTGVGYSYGCEGVSSCGDDFGRRVLNRTCSGYSAQCDGQNATGAFEVTVACQPYQICSPQSSGCINDQLCTCTCSSGACCDGCHYKPVSFVCNDNLGIENGCPWGSGTGSNVGVRYLQQRCSGSSDACSGQQVYSEWQIKEDCGEDEACINGECVNVEPCQSNSDCPANHYCSNGDCKEHVFPCDGDSDCPPDANMFCNTQYEECMPIDGQCSASSDCAGHADGPYCDSIYHFCYGPHCITDSGNCRPGTMCGWASAYVDNGFYCQGCDDNADCSDGMICRKRPWLPGVCLFE